MNHVIFLKTDFKGLFIKSRSSIRFVRKTDDVMSDDVIVDYIITKNGEMTLLVYVSPFKGWTLGRFWWFKIMLKCSPHLAKGLIFKNSTRKKNYRWFTIKIWKKIMDFSQTISCNFLTKTQNAQNSTPLDEANIWANFESIESVLGFIP